MRVHCDKLHASANIFTGISCLIELKFNFPGQKFTFLYKVSDNAKNENFYWCQDYFDLFEKQMYKCFIVVFSVGNIGCVVIRMILGFLKFKSRRH